jgi:FkbM family methyltransferase
VGAFKIDAFEPNMKNNLRFCESVIMDGWEHDAPGRASINIWPLGLSESTGTKKFYEWNGNPGAGHFDHPGRTRTDFSHLPVTTLDAFAEERGWFKSRPEIVIMKIDVEHHETNMLAGAEKLLKSGIVKNIFLDLFLDSPAERGGKLQALELIIKSGYTLKAQGSWSGPDHPSLWNNDENLATYMLAYFEKENMANRNLWWTL